MKLTSLPTAALLSTGLMGLMAAPVSEEAVVIGACPSTSRPTSLPVAF
jgi:hypothetical protein